MESSLALGPADETSLRFILLVFNAYSRFRTYTKRPLRFMTNKSLIFIITSGVLLNYFVFGRYLLILFIPE